MSTYAARRSRRKRFRTLSLVESAFGKVGAIASSLSAAAGIGWAVWHYASPPPPPQLDAHVVGIKDGFYPGITLRQFFELDRMTVDESSSGYSAEQLNCRFAYLQVRVTVDGYKGHQVWLRWMLNADNGNQIGPLLKDQIEPLTVQRAHDSDIASAHLLLPARRHMRVRAQLFRKHGTRLLQFSEPYASPSFDGPKTPQSRNCPE
jgi:hypothetical protein